MEPRLPPANFFRTGCIGGARTLGREEARVALFRFFNHGFGADDHHYAIIGYGVAGAVGFGVVADYGAFWQAYMAIDNCAANTAAAPDIHVIEDDAGIEFAVAIYPHVEAEDRMHNAAARNDGARANNGIERDAHSRGIGENKFRRRILLLPRVQRPALVIEVENRRDRNQIHVGLVIGLDGADIAPIRFFFFIFIPEVVGEDAMLFDNARDDVFAEIVFGIRIFGVGDENGHQELRIKEIDAHRGVHLIRVHARGLGICGLFLKSDDAPVFICFDDAETARGLLLIYLKSCDGDIRAASHVLPQLLRLFLFENRAPKKKKQVFRFFGTDGINVLIDRV